MYCPPLTIKFLGTGTSSGVPMIACKCEVCTSTDKKNNRLRSSILVESATTVIVVDTTPDFRFQMLRAKVDKLDAVLYTHPHKDHVAGLDDIKAYNYFQRSPVSIYCNKMTEAALQKEFSYIFAHEKYPGIPDIDIQIISEKESFVVGDIPVQPILVWHLRMPVLAYRFGHFVYITDANRIEDDELAKMKGCKGLAINALRHEKHISHFNLPEAIEMAEKINAGTTYFTHISHQLGLYDEVEKSLPEKIHLAYDGLELKISEYLS